MSNSLAIAAVTATLRNLLQGAIALLSPGAQVTVRPLDRARENMTVDSVNLFLYNTAFTYHDMGYACTLAWFIFAIGLVITIGLFATSGRWVYYASGD